MHGTMPSSSFKAYAEKEKEKIMDAYGLLNQINNSSESKGLIDEKITHFLDFMNEMVVKGDEVRISTQQDSNFDQAEIT